MKTPKMKYRIAALLLALMLLVLGGCGGNSEDSGTAAVRLLNAGPGYAAMDLYVDDSKVNAAVAAGAQGSYTSVDASEVLSTVLTSAGSSTALSTTSRSAFHSGTACSVSGTMNFLPSGFSISTMSVAPKFSTAQTRPTASPVSVTTGRPSRSEK